MEPPHEASMIQGFQCQTLHVEMQCRFRLCISLSQPVDVIQYKVSSIEGVKRKAPDEIDLQERSKLRRQGFERFREGGASGCRDSHFTDSNEARLKKKTNHDRDRQQQAC